MLQAKNPLISVITGLLQGLFRAGHLFLIALGLIALTQIIPVPKGAMGTMGTMSTAGTTKHLDAMGGSAEGMIVPAEAQSMVSPAARWFASVQSRVAEAVMALNPMSNAAALPAASDSVAEAPQRAVSASTSRLTTYLANRYRVSDQVVENLVVTAQEIGRELGVDPLLIVSVIAVESSFNPLSESKFGAQGLMQVIPKYHTDKIADASQLALFKPETNIRVGAMVLNEYIQRTGSVESALQTYAGAASDPEAGYARKVLGTRERLVQAMRG